MFELVAAAQPPIKGFRLSSGRVLPTTPVFDIYWRFAFERQEMFYRRVEGAQPPWTTDPILRVYRFTNPYRAADRVSQYLIRHVIYDGDQSAEEVCFRTLLFKVFNRIETWTLLKEQIGTLSWRSFDLKQYDAVLGGAMRRGAKIYSPAYIMPSPSFGSQKKHTNHLHLLTKMMETGLSEQVASAKSLKDVYLKLRSYPSLGNFLSFQFAIDLNYSELMRFSEMDCVIAGPGARSGIRKAFLDVGELSDEDIIREVTEAAEREFSDRELEFRKLWGRPLQLIDCQNLFCEVDKYSRVALPSFEGGGRTRIKRRYRASLSQIPQWYPPKWGLKVPGSFS
jgi:hypothetical protein